MNLLHPSLRGLGFTLLVLSKITFAADLQTDSDPETLLQRIRSKAAGLLSHLPSYTCLEVVDRWVKHASGGSLMAVDRVEFEVAFVGNREYFAPRGGARFDTQSITNLVPGGTIGNGAFGAHVGAIFATDSPSFQYAGPSKKDGHKTFRYDFTVPQEKSHFLLRGTGQGIVAFKGSFWVDTETLDLVRLELTVDHIPPYIGVRLLQESLQYSTAKIRDSDVLLARRSEMSAIDASGNYSLNQVNLKDCREFTGESTVTFGATTNDPSADRTAPPDR